MDETEIRTETLTARGHENVTGEHASTFEVTSDDYLTPAGDCILAIESDRVPADFDDAFVRACQCRESTITVTLSTEAHTEKVTASGHPDLTFESERSLVVRTSEYVDDRTVAVDADRAAGDLDRELIAALAGGNSVSVTLAVNSS